MTELQGVSDAERVPLTEVAYWERRWILGRVVRRQLVASPERVPLPSAYYYADPSVIHTDELGQLWRQVEVGRHLTDYYLRQRPIWAAQRGAEQIDVGVRAANGVLVGFGSVQYKGACGEMQEFVVSPTHQCRGIGKAVIDERLRLAAEYGIDSLYIPRLEHSNTLAWYYLQRGFCRTGRGELVRGPNPVSITGSPPGDAVY